MSSKLGNPNTRVGRELGIAQYESKRQLQITYRAIPKILSNECSKILGNMVSSRTTFGY